jgi:hypothetical protein
MHEADDVRVDWRTLRMLVYDEADQMMSPLFDADLAAIHACLPARKQVSIGEKASRGRQGSPTQRHTHLSCGWARTPRVGMRE